MIYWRWSKDAHLKVLCILKYEQMHAVTPLLYNSPEVWISTDKTADSHTVCNIFRYDAAS